jgi:hypothetical protein
MQIQIGRVDKTLTVFHKTCKYIYLHYLNPKTYSNLIESLDLTHPDSICTYKIVITCESE